MANRRYLWMYTLVCTCLIVSFQNCSKQFAAQRGATEASSNSGPSPDPTPMPGPPPSPAPGGNGTLAKACDGSAFPTGANIIFAGQNILSNWGAYSFSGPGPNTKDTSLPCTAGHAFTISYVMPADQYVGVVLATNAANAIAGARHVSFDIYVSVDRTLIATSAPYAGQPNDHLFWLVKNKQNLPTQTGNPEAIFYPRGWTHVDFDVDLSTKPVGKDNVVSVAFEKWNPGTVTVAIDNLIIY